MSETKIENEVENEEVVGIETFFADEMSPYGMMVAVNKVLKALGSDKVLPGPMFYTYTKKGYIPTVDEANKRVAKADAVEWTEGYITKLARKAAAQAEPVNEVQEALDALSESEEASESE